MLNQLKNDELFPFFRSEVLIKEGSFQWVDLWALSESLKASDAVSDTGLEAILYGTQAEPSYSGFTQKRIQSWVERLGSGTLEVDSQQKYMSSGHVVNPKLDESKEILLHKKLSQIRFRENRKRLRKKLKELGCRIISPLAYSKLLEPVRLNLGAGDENYQDFIKVDWAGAQHIFDDIVLLKKIKSGSVSEIYSNHVLEHIPPFLIDPMLRRWKEVLKPEGVLRLRMPDARQAIKSLGASWNEVKEAEVSKLGFPNYLARENEREGIVTEEMAIQFVYGWSDVMPGFWDLSNQHKSLWTPKLTKQRLERAGFVVEMAQNYGTLQTIALAKKPK